LISSVFARNLKRRAVVVLALLGPCGLVLGTLETPAAAAPPNPPSATVDSGDGWTVERAAGGYVVSLELNARLPIKDDTPELVADGTALGPATESADGLSLSLTTADPAVSTASQIAWEWTSGGPTTPHRRARRRLRTGNRGAAPPLGDDPTTPGRYPYTEAVYNFGAQAIPLANIGGVRGEVEGKIYLPRAGRSHPLVIFLHGRHSSCFKERPGGADRDRLAVPDRIHRDPQLRRLRRRRRGVGQQTATRWCRSERMRSTPTTTSWHPTMARWPAASSSSTRSPGSSGQRRSAVTFYDAAKNQTVGLDQALGGTGLSAASLINTMDFTDIG